MNEPVLRESPSADTNAKIVYILYMVGIAFGITGIVGVVMAYIYKDESAAWLQSHYQFQIRTFWIGGIYIFLGTILSLVLVGWLILLFWVVWLVIRCVKGIQLLDKKQPHPNPTAWLF